jgi:hypothetical protein
MNSFDRCYRPTNVYEMMERLGLESAAGVVRAGSGNLHRTLSGVSA